MWCCICKYLLALWIGWSLNVPALLTNGVAVTGRCKGRTYFTITPIFPTVEIKLWMWSFLLLTTSLLQALTQQAFQIRLNMIGNRLQKWIRNTSGSSCLLRINERSINNTRQTSPSSLTNNSPRKTQTASDDQLIYNLRKREMVATIYLIISFNVWWFFWVFTIGI